MTTKNRRSTNGNGSLYFNEARDCWELAHTAERKRYIERVSRKGRTDAECKAACRAKRSERLRLLEAEAGLDPETLGWLGQEWLAVRCKGLAAGTLAGYTTEVRRITERLGEVQSNELTLHHVQRFLVALVDEGLRPATLAKTRFVLSSMCDSGVAWNKMRSNPVRSLGRSPKGEAVARDHRWYDVAEYDQALGYIVDPDNFDPQVAIVAVMLLAGLRSAEVRALRWSAIDWSRGLLRVEQAVKAVSNAVGVTKTRSGNRVVPMVPELVAVLRRQAEAQMAAGRSEYVFAGSTGGIVSHSAVTVAVEAFARQTGLDYINPHAFRHTFASIALHRGMGYKLLAKLLGHKDETMIIRTYAHVVVDVETIDMRLFAGGAGGQREAM